MSEENLALTRRWVEAVNERDLDAALALMDEAVESFSRIVAIEGSLRGHDGYRRWWDAWFDTFPDYRIEIVELQDHGDVVIGAFRALGHGAGSELPFEDVAWISTRWREGKCVWWRVCLTEAEARQTAGLSEGAPTLYDWAGGEEALRRFLDAFYDRAERDELISPYFPGGVREEHRDHVTAWWCEVFGGPTRYTDELGGYENMLRRHRDLGITTEARRRFVALLSVAADDVGLPDDPEFRSALLAYAEWGTRLAMHNSQPGAEVAEHAPTPRWGWGEAPPFEG